MKHKPALHEIEPNVFVSSRCNQACVFCSARGGNRGMGERELNSVLDRGFETLALEGGEPLLDKNLEKRVRRAVKRGSKEIILFTNGLLLDAGRTKSLLKSGVTKFNFNLPAHTGVLHDKLTGLKGKLTKKIRIIKETVKLSSPDTVVITFVLNELNYAALPDFVEFVSRELKGISYLSINLVKIKGLVKKNTWLVPRLSVVKPYLLTAFEKAKTGKLRIITDGFPLCFMNGFEHLSIDPPKLLRRDKLYMGEKNRSAACSSCRLACVCAGPRRDYALLRGTGELFPSKVSAGKVISAVLSNGANKP